MSAHNDLGRDEIGKLVLRIALPSMLAQFVSVLYSIVDRMYIGHIPGEGGMALAGVGVCGPVVTMVGSVAYLVAVGGAPLMSMRMGEGREDEAAHILSTCTRMLVAAALLITALVLPLRGPMLRLFGASESLYPCAEAYFTVYICGTLFALLASGLNQFIIAQGFARTGMLLVMLGAALNIALDPVFIFLLGWGVRGAAAATVLSQLASASGALWFLTRGQAALRLTRRPFSAQLAKKVLRLGFAPFSIVAVDNAMIIAMNAVLQRYGGAAQGDMLITCATIAQSFMLVVTMPLGGISSGTQTILAFNYGAMRMDRVREGQRRIFSLCVLYTAVMFVLAWLVGPLFVRLFTRDAQQAALSGWAIRVCTLAIIPLGLQYEVVDGFTALGQVRLSFALS
ncbi:MAG: MATE family efflux transporter, partial [Candidatus Ventricola sp.]|nr:MATE family efflux transporter [Candidatus Ventricola sp.]